jgi:hypothetical protein
MYWVKARGVIQIYDLKIKIKCRYQKRKKVKWNKVYILNNLFLIIYYTIWLYQSPSSFAYGQICPCLLPSRKKPVALVQSRISTHEVVATWRHFHLGIERAHWSKGERNLIAWLSLQVNWWTHSEGQSQQLHLFISQWQIIFSHSSPWVRGMELAGGAFSLCWHPLLSYPRLVNQERPYCKVCNHFPADICGLFAARIG